MACALVRVLGLDVVTEVGVAHGDKEQVDRGRLTLTGAQAAFQGLDRFWKLAEPVIDHPEAVPVNAILRRQLDGFLRQGERLMRVSLLLTTCDVTQSQFVTLPCRNRLKTPR